MARYVETGALDAGITGHDWVVETSLGGRRVAELIYAKQRLARVRRVLACLNTRPFTNRVTWRVKRTAMESSGSPKLYLARHGVTARVDFSWGATEVKVQLADAIVEVTETGSSLRANCLRIIDTVLESATVIMNRQAVADPWKREKAEKLDLDAARRDRRGQRRSCLLLNVRRDDLFRAAP